MYSINVENGVRLAVQDTGSSGRNAVLFVHGWPLSHKIFEYQYNILPDYGIRCVGYDLRGHGDSDKPRRGYSYNRMADDLYRIIRSLNCRSVTLLGFSMGGAIAARYMARYRGYRVNKLILAGAAAPQFVQSDRNPCGFTADQVNDLVEQAYGDRPAVCESFGKICFASKVSGAYRSWFRNECWRASGLATIRGLEYLRDETLYDDLPEIRVPTMILHGKKDLVCPFEFAGQMQSLIPSSFVVPFESSGHCLFYDERKKFCDQLMAFVNEYGK